MSKSGKTIEVSSDACDVVVCGYSTVILEALEADCTVVNINQNETSQNIDLCEIYPSIEKIKSCTDINWIKIKSKENLICYTKSSDFIDIIVSVL